MDLSELPAQPAAVQRHPWERSRYRFFGRVLARLVQPRPSHVLDVGSGDAWLASQLLAPLSSETRFTCWDLHYAPDLMALLARSAGPHIRLTAERPTERFELVLLLDVLEHVEQDAEFLKTLVRENLAPQGLLLISVPAWQGLFTAHDMRRSHYRRYTPAAAARLLEHSGLTIESRGGLFHGLLAPRVAAKVRELVWSPTSRAVLPQPLSWSRGPLATRALDWLLASDNALSWLASRASIDLPGLSWWALCRKS